ncbi:MAG TPA: HD domain-containing protein [Spirochaetota bacterium]|nr:HD domain-containing protein [Spirochaetota bacterium]HPI88803.1 HD domain-containing protein [Spirochaetota bacterium]HPR47123.1 HD domain-containing protein [Spirochaetota bacterium]
MLDNNRKLNEILRLSSELNTIQDLDILLEKILFEARSFVNADAGSIQITEGNNLIFSHVQTDSLQRKLPPGQKLIYTTFKIDINRSSISGYVACTGEALSIKDAYRISPDAPYKFNSSYDEKSGYKTQSMLAIPLITNRKEILGVMQIINKLDASGRVIPFDKDDELYALHFANTASMILQRAQMTRALILRMISMAELRDPKETGAHVNRVASYAVELYEKWAHNHALPRQEIDKKRDILRMAAMLHDVGKVAISDLILKKPSRLTGDEFEIMKTHTIQGANLFKQQHSEFDDISIIVALRHHENWDGTGYPGHIDIKTGEILEKDANGRPLPFRGDEIPIFGRIVALADVYDALSSRRVYKSAWDEKDVLDEIKAQSGKKFDPEIVDIFFDSLDMMRSIAARYPDTE